MWLRDARILRSVKSKHTLPAGSPNEFSRFEPLNRGNRRKEAESIANQMSPPRYLSGYDTQVHGEGGCRPRYSTTYSNLQP